jgi:hypothetical protein
MSENEVDAGHATGPPVALPAMMTDFILLDFSLWGCMKSKVYYTGKPKTRQQLLEFINESTAAIRKMKIHQNIRLQWSDI